MLAAWCLLVTALYAVLAVNDPAGAGGSVAVPAAVLSIVVPLVVGRVVHHLDRG